MQVKTVLGTRREPRDSGTQSNPRAIAIDANRAAHGAARARLDRGDKMTAVRIRRSGAGAIAIMTTDTARL